MLRFTQILALETILSGGVLNRLTHKGYPDATGVDCVYDLAEKIKQVTDPTGTYGFAYDNMGRLVGTTTQYSCIPGQTFTNAYAYDAASNRTSFTSPHGGTDTYAYDTLNQLASITDSATGQFTFGYDGLGRRTALNRPNGVNTSYGYNSLSRLLSVLHQTGTTTIDGDSYTYDGAGNRTAKTNLLNNINEQYTYDAIYQLTQVVQGATTSESYSYDAVGNRLSSLGMAPYAYNSSNQLTSMPAVTFTYDNNGNTLTKVNSSGTTQYTWDFENRLNSVVLPASGGTVTFKYDPFGRRVQKSSAVGTTNYLYNGSNIAEEVDQSGACLARYAQGAGIDEPLAELRGGTAGFYEQDGLGSVTSLSGSVSALANSYAYDSFGILTGSTGTMGNPFQYAGRDYDSETGLRYYRARYYDSSVGRFINEDPSTLSGGLNLYKYVDNDPLNAMDPFGLAKCYLWFTRGNGWLYCVPDSKDLLPLLIPVASGNNGNGQPCKNTHNCDQESGHGAIPTGWWTWGGVSASHASRGGSLIPDKGTYQDRNGILSHSCLSFFSMRAPSPGHKYCSEGCVTATEDNIALLNQLIDAEPKSRLYVYGTAEAPFAVGAPPK